MLCLLLASDSCPGSLSPHGDPRTLRPTLSTSSLEERKICFQWVLHETQDRVSVSNGLITERRYADGSDLGGGQPIQSRWLHQNHIGLEE